MVKTYIKGQNVQLSQNFCSQEFRCGLGSGCSCTTILIDEALVAILQKIRDYFGQEVTITSGHRCASYNMRVAKTTASYHTKGMAADISVKNVPPRAVAAFAESIGCLGIGLYETAADGYFVHIDTRPSKYFWYGKSEASRSTFGGKEVYEKYKCAAAQSGVSTSTVVTTAPADKADYAIYIVKSGDTLAKIAAKYTGVTYTQIADLNGLKTPYVIYVGQSLKIPCKTQSNLSTNEIELSTTVENLSTDYSKANYESSPDELYWLLLDRIGNIYGVCGLLGNLNAESNLVSACLEISARNKVGHTSKSYTDAVDSGKYLRFTTDYAGYGIAQWTDAPRKTALLAYAKKKNASIGNRKMQAEFLMSELEGRFAAVLNILKSASSVRQASNAVLMRFECPSVQSLAVQDRRSSYGENYYKKFKDAKKPSGKSNADTVPYFCTVTAELLNVRNGPGTSNSILRRISTGTACEIVEEKDGWGRLCDGGWVSLQYVKK